MRNPSSWARWATLVVALLLLNASLTFHNVWPTLAVRLATPPEVSPELALVLLALVAWRAWRSAARSSAGAADALPAAQARTAGLPRGAVTTLALLSVLFLLARYAEVTAPALYGRPVNLYWDARHVGNVVRMLVEVAGGGLALLVVAGALVATALAFLAFRAAWSRLGTALESAPERRALGVLAGLATVAWIASLLGAPVAPGQLRYSLPVTATCAQQARLIGSAFLAARASPPRTASAGPGSTSGAGRDVPAARTFDALAGDDVLLVFVESYGAITYTRPELVARLEPPRRALDDAIAATGRRVASATVTAPTFGGNSWLSHLTLLTGVEVADPDAYARTMQSPRATLVHEFAAAGYRTIALMPGLRYAWPEGAFYRFDAILGADALAYRGPEFGWWRIPDQYALASLEREPRDGRPRFVFFPTISSHAPFRPTPPYQPDWERLDDERPFGDDASAALAAAPDWTNLAPAYGDTIAYAHEWLAGWLRRHADADATLVVLGDHQPPAAVSGPGADWTVPVHVITRRDEVLRPLLAAGFVAGLQPPAAPLMRMHALRPVLRAAFAGATAEPADVRTAAVVPDSAVGAGRAARHDVARPIVMEQVRTPRVHVARAAGEPRVAERGE